MSNFENKNLAELSKQDTSIDRLREIINDSTIQTREQIAGYLTLLGLKIENNPSSLEIQKRASQRETLIAELRQAGYPASLNNLPISKLEKLKKIPNGSEVIKNEDLLTMQLEKQQTTIKSAEKATDAAEQLAQVHNPKLKATYKKLLDAGKRVHHQPAFLVPPAMRPGVIPSTIPKNKFEIQAQKKTLKNKSQKDRKDLRTKFKIGPLTRGFFARKRLESIQTMMNQAQMLGYKDPEQLFKAGFLNKGSLKRIENKQKLIVEATRLGLNPQYTTAHELNVERRIHQLGLDKIPLLGGRARWLMNLGNRTLTSNQAITEIDPLKHSQQRFMPRRLAWGIGFPRRIVGKVINKKTLNETKNISKGILKGILEVKNQLEGKGGGDKK